MLSFNISKYYLNFEWAWYFFFSLSVNVSYGRNLQFNFLPFEAYILENACPTNKHIAGEHNVLRWRKDVANFCVLFPLNSVLISVLKPSSLNTAWTTSSWVERRSFLGQPLQWLEECLLVCREASAADLLPKVVKTGQSRTIKKCNLALLA